MFNEIYNTINDFLKEYYGENEMNEPCYNMKLLAEKINECVCNGKESK